MSYLAPSRRIATYLVARTGTSVPEEVLAYAAEVLFLNLLGVILALLLAFPAGVSRETLFCLGTVAILRSFAGGAHSTSPIRCMIITGLVFPALGFVAQRCGILGPSATGRLLAAACGLGLIAVALFAPVASPAAPIVSRRRRMWLKTGAIVATVLLSAAGLVLGGGAWRASISVGIFWSAFILTPAAHRLFCLIDSLILKERGGARN